MDYLEWNDLIVRHFFRPEMADRRVYLYVTVDLIEELGKSRDADLQNFVDAVTAGPPWVTRKGMCQKALQTLRNWRHRGRECPPYVAFIALFVLAGGIEGDFAPHAYYPRLRKLLGEEPAGGQYPSFHYMLELWDDLEQWSTDDKFGELGVFKSHIAGSWIHVGVPTAQTILTEDERRHLPTVFAEAGLDPALPPSDEELMRLVADNGHGRLRPRTLELLRRRTKIDEDLAELAAQVLLDELQNWDGTVQTATPSGHGLTRLYVSLVLCCRLDRVAATVNVTIRCRSSKDFPEDGLSLKAEGSPETFYCEASALGWSTPLTLGEGRTFNAARINWKEGFRLREEQLGWWCRLSPSPIRILVEAASFGLPGLVEVHQVPSVSPFYLAVPEESVAAIEKWGEAGCKDFRNLGITSGLPAGWQMFYVQAVVNDGPIRHTYPMLAIAQVVRIDLESGLRVSRGNRFFKFAPPHVAMRGGRDNIKVFCNGNPLLRKADEVTYTLPEDLPTEERLTVEAYRGSEHIASRSFQLAEESQWPVTTVQQWFDRFGRIGDQNNNDENIVAGAVVQGVPTPGFAFNTLLSVSEHRRVIFVGRQPGQIIDWPKEDLPTGWSAVWAVPMRRRGQAVFCGHGAADSAPSQERCGNRKKVKLWKEVIWHWRKRICPPEPEYLKKLWLEYQNEASRL